MWAKIIYHYLIQENHMTDVMHDRACLIYDLMLDDVDMNLGVVIFLAMKKLLYH